MHDKIRTLIKQPGSNYREHITAYIRCTIFTDRINNYDLPFAATMKFQIDSDLRKDRFILTTI